jgi:hypothetical protein
VSDKKVAISYLVKRFVEAAELGPLARHRAWTSSISLPTLQRLGLEPAAEALSEEPAAGEGILDVVQRHDFERSLAEGLLTKADRAGMRWAVETRAPFLDVAVMEFAAALPQKERVSGFTTKVFLKRYAEGGRSPPEAGLVRSAEPLAAWPAARLGGGEADIAPAGRDRRRYHCRRRSAGGALRRPGGSCPRPMDADRRNRMARLARPLLSQRRRRQS